MAWGPILLAESALCPYLPSCNGRSERGGPSIFTPDLFGAGILEEY